MSDRELVHQLEERSRLEPERVVRLIGQVDDDAFELLIFRGFSSSTTHPIQDIHKFLLTNLTIIILIK